MAPLKFAVNHTFYRVLPLTPFNNKGYTEHMTQMAGLYAFQLEAAMKFFHAPSPTHSWMNSISLGMWEFS